jgi:uncharacterized protein (TIGR02246 family)
MVNAQTKQDEEAVRGLPKAFCDAFNKHDGHELAKIMAEDVDFVTVGLTWLHGRADFEKYHTRLLIAFALGVSSGDGRTTSAAAATVGPPAAFGTLAETSQRLTAEVQRMTADLGALKVDNAKLLAEHVNVPVARADGLIGEPLPRHEVQETILKNLRKIMAARDQFHVEHARAPTSIEEIVGIDGYFKRLVPVDGEDYSLLSMEKGRVLVITTLSGITVKYGDGTGDEATTQVEYPPEMARAKALLLALKPAAKAAYEAYRLANQGKDPDDADALLPFFATPQERAVYLEFREANKTANKR